MQNILSLNVLAQKYHILLLLLYRVLINNFIAHINFIYTLWLFAMLFCKCLGLAFTNYTKI